MSKLQELLKGLKMILLPTSAAANKIEALITKYTETTPTYKPGDRILITKSCLKTFNGTKGYLIELYLKEEKLWKIEHSAGICYFSEEEFEPIN